MDLGSLSSTDLGLRRQHHLDEMEAAKGRGGHVTWTRCALAVTDCLQEQDRRLHHPDPKHTEGLTEFRSMCETSLAALTLGNL